jgi:D-hydroxyproline dehydrogenase subunit beta
MKTYDLLVVGAGIVGLAHAYEARRRGLKVAVIEKNMKCVGASIRNFGFITVSGQSSHHTWRRAMHSRQVWKEITEKAGIPIIHNGSWVICQRPEAFDVAHAFLKTEMGNDCQLFASDDFSLLPKLGFKNTKSLKLEQAEGLFYSPHEFRVESKQAIPMLSAWLESIMGVDFYWGLDVLDCEVPHIKTSMGEFYANRVVICTGAELNGLVKPYLDPHSIRLCTLQMLRIKLDADFTLPGSVMTDLSLARYLGWSDLPEATPLKERIKKELPNHVAEGIHLIAVQSADGSLVVGDSHRYGPTDEVFADENIDQMILDLIKETLEFKTMRVLERWTGVYPSSANQDALIEKVNDRLRIAVVTSGTGASTAFGLAKDNFDEWIGE